MESQPNAQPSEAEKFLSAMRKIVSIPKEEILRREQVDKEQRKERKKKNRTNDK